MLVLFSFLLILLLIIFGVSFVSGILYRMGGSEKYGTLYRDIGCPIVGLSLLTFLWGWNNSFVFCFFLYWATLSTYWDFINKFFGDDENEKWYNWYLHGLGISLAMLPYSINTGNYGGDIIRIIVLPIAITIWTVFAEKFIEKSDVWAEFGRGFLITCTLPWILIK